MAFGQSAPAVFSAGQRSADDALGIAAPVLLGPASEDILTGAARTPGELSLFRTADRLAGYGTALPGEDLEAAALRLHRGVLQATAGLHLYRIWNYVPRINAVEADLENYRRFCRGRSLAFEEHFGQRFQRQLPAGSAVGLAAGPLALVFLAGRAAPQHFENPHQIPAFEYPALYGPRPPSFSRATLVAAAGRRTLFISGTAAIRGHATVAAGDLAGQLACTRDNLHVIAATAGTPLDARRDDRRRFKVYVRHAADLPAIRADLAQHLLRPTDTVTYLHTDLCRSDLLVEIEAIVEF